MAKKQSIHGFSFHQAFLKEFDFLKKESYRRPTASALACFLTLLAQRDHENNPRGVLREYRLREWAEKTNINYSSLHGGLEWLYEHHFVKDVILEDGTHALLIRDWEKHTNIERSGESLNYFRVPYALFETDFLAEAVRTSNPESIELLCRLLNQFRTALGHNSNATLSQTYNMSTLKKQLNKNAKGVRRVLSIFESLISVEYIGLSYRKHQVWINQVKFTLKPECVTEQSDEFEVSSLMQKFNQELVHFLDAYHISYKARDQKQVMISFKQEIFHHLRYVEKTQRDTWLRRFFVSSLHRIEAQMKKVAAETGTFTFRSIGAYFRITFRNLFKEELPALAENYRALFHDAFFEEYKQTNTVPSLKASEIF
ncbi:hypothetical protein IM538_18545 [Cytobacillus suaedae]|nr:hypothetical protein IM538_18545 [Cytobacillus suaedae]